MNMNRGVKKILGNECVDYQGFADLTPYAERLADFGGDIVRGYKVGISIGIALPDSIVDHLPRRDDPNVACEYKIHCYHAINARLDHIASKLSGYLNGKGYETLPIAAAERTNEAEAIPTVSHKMIARLAGLGWIGKNCLLVTPDHGPRVRFTSILTNAPLQTSNFVQEQRCGTCGECAKICPAHAIRGVEYTLGSPREERFDFKKCQDYFDQLKTRGKWDVCGMCLYVCPHGRSKRPVSAKTGGRNG